MMIYDQNSDAYSIVKIFKDQSSWQAEQRYLNYLRQQDLSVPEITCIEPLILHMKVIQGKTACELIEDYEAADQNMPEQNLQALVSLMREIYQTPLFRDNHLILGDVNWRNFLLSDQDHKVYRIDLESVRTGDITDEAGSLIAFLLTYKPELTKIKCQAASLLSSLLCQQLDINKDRLSAAVSNQLRIIDQRRGTQYHQAFISRHIF